MLLGWDDLGDYSRFTNRDEIVDEMRKVYDNPKGRFSNDSLAVWEFAKVMKPGDTVYAKRVFIKLWVEVLLKVNMNIMMMWMNI